MPIHHIMVETINVFLQQYALCSRHLCRVQCLQDALMERVFSAERITVYAKTCMTFHRYNKNARRPTEAHIAQNLKKIEILDRDGKDLKKNDQH